MAGHLNGAAMCIEHLFSNAESESRAIGLRGIERIEDLRDAVLGNAAAVIAQPDYTHSRASVLAGYALDCQFDAALALDLGHRIDRIVYNVRKDLPQLVGVGAHGWSIKIRAGDRDRVGFEFGAQLEQGAIKYGGKIDVFEMVILFLGEFQQMRDAAFDACEFVHGDPRIFDIFGGGRVLAHLLDKAARRGNRVANLMSEGGSQFIERRLLFGAQYFLFLLHLALHFAFDGGNEDSLMNPTPAEDCGEV